MKKAILIITLIVSFSNMTFGQAAAIGGFIAGDAVVKDVLNKFGQQAQQLLSQANTDGNALVGRIGNELNVATENAGIMLQKNLDKQVSQLTTQESRILESIGKLNSTAIEVSDKAYNLKDATVLDLRKILGDYMPFGKVLFYVQSVNGITQLNSDINNYKLTVNGIGFGFDSENFKSKVVAINDFAASDFNEVKTTANQSQITLQKSKINLFLDKSKISQVMLTLKVQVQRRSGLIIKTWNTKFFTVPLTLSIIPNTLNDLVVNYTIPKFDWVTTADPITYSFITPDYHTSDKNPPPRYTDSYQSVSGKKRYVNPRLLNNSGAGCPWTHFEFVHVEENETKLHAQSSEWGLPCTFVYGATLQEYKQTGLSDGPPTTIKGITYGGNLVVTIPNTCKYWVINGRTVDFNPINIIQQSGDGRLITFSNMIDDGINYKVVYKVGYPY